jgi:hypothetical protein
MPEVVMPVRFHMLAVNDAELCQLQPDQQAKLESPREQHRRRWPAMRRHI